ncbi:hypothetical protein KIK06_12555 [Nocardiopsis sp. EMB25]|uniref:hypothetical protein n=1 Tax=Nocardiopsis sp. EMB25 TaxID=2835867 RepID=UPI002284BDFF|nr:hypothetical protein [Nocardiopsis sp. EMB25]MCY9784722.1 hypothetical protein [Nocardiopsis sp. EMB25]
MPTVVTTARALMIVGACLELLMAGGYGSYLLYPDSAFLTGVETSDDPAQALVVLLTASGWAIASGALASLLRGGGPAVLWSVVAFQALSIPSSALLAALDFVPAAAFGFFAVATVALLMTSDGRAYFRRARTGPPRYRPDQRGPGYPGRPL